jgi:hypothetical protein
MDFRWVHIFTPSQIIVSNCFSNLTASSAMAMVASKTVISPKFFIILRRHVRERMGLVESLRLLGLLKSWGSSKREAGGRARYVQYQYLVFLING